MKVLKDKIQGRFHGQEEVEKMLEAVMLEDEVRQIMELFKLKGLRIMVHFM